MKHTVSLCREGGAVGKEAGGETQQVRPPHHHHTLSNSCSLFSRARTPKRENAPVLHLCLQLRLQLPVHLVDEHQNARPHRVALHKQLRALAKVLRAQQGNHGAHSQRRCGRIQGYALFVPE
jgi:hypothetical protein